MIYSDVLFDDSRGCIRPFCRLCINLCHYCLLDYPRTIVLHSPDHDSIHVCMLCELNNSTYYTYRFMLPTFMNIFIIYSFCNVHDVTWGTRDSNLINNDKAQHEMEVSYSFVERMIGRYKRFRSKLVLFWVAGNFIYAGGILLFNATAVYGVILTIIIGILFGYRFVGSIAYQVIKLYKYYTKYHATSGRRHLFQTVASDRLYQKTKA